jgi:ornithine cyclodeaminase/alanine dehydrogenase
MDHTTAPVAAREEFERRAGGRLLYLSRADVERCALTVDEIEHELRDALVARGRGQVESPPKHGILPRPDASIRAMMANVPGHRAAGVKWVAAYPGNVSRGLPTISAVMILNNIETGVVKAVMDGTWITAMRTAACTRLAARYFARPDSSTVGVVACGLQGRANLEALASIYALREVRVFDPDPGKAECFAEAASLRLQVPVEVVDRPAAAARGADIVVTSAPIRKRPEPTIRVNDLARGTWACALDFDATLDETALATADRLLVDDLEQLNSFRSHGWFRRTPRPDDELPAVAAGRRPGRLDDGERIVSIHLGIG